MPDELIWNKLPAETQNEAGSFRRKAISNSVIILPSESQDSTKYGKYK